MVPYMVGGLRQAVEALLHATESLKQGVMQNDEQLAEVRQRVTSPKRIIRDPRTGRPVGIEAHEG
jgi:hypothetical protein